MDITFDITPIVILVVTALIGALGTLFGNWLTKASALLREKIGAEKFNKLKSFIESLVRAAEQTIRGSGVGEQKFNYVLNQAESWIESKGLDVDMEEVKIEIEAKVNELFPPSAE